MQTMTMRIEDVVDFPERGIVLLVSFESIWGRPRVTLCSE